LSCETKVKVIDEVKGVVGVADLVCGDYVLELKSSTRIRMNHVYQLLIYGFATHKEGFLSLRR